MVKSNFRSWKVANSVRALKRSVPGLTSILTVNSAQWYVHNFVNFVSKSIFKSKD